MPGKRGRPTGPRTGNARIASRVEVFEADLQDRAERWERLRERMEDRGLLPSHLCEAVGLDPSCWTHWKNGKRVPSGAALATLERYFAAPAPAQANLVPVDDDLTEEEGEAMDAMMAEALGMTLEEMRARGIRREGPFVPAPVQAPKPEPMPVVQGAGFAKPHFIEELGEEGVTAHEIATSLGVEVFHVHEKLKRGDWHSGVCTEFRQTAFTMKQEIREVTGHAYRRKVETFALNTRAAKAFVARWGNETGDRYLNFLFECEAAVFEHQKAAGQLESKLKDSFRQLQRENQEMKKLLANGKSGELAALSAAVDRLTVENEKLRHMAYTTSSPARPGLLEESLEVARKLLEARKKGDLEDGPKSVQIARQAARKSGKKYLTQKELSERYNRQISVKTLTMWRWQMKGPPFTKIGGRVLYDADEVEVWDAMMKGKTK